MGPFRDIALGCYYLTKEKDEEGLEQKEKNRPIKMFSGASEAIIAYESGFLNLQEKIKVPNPKKQKEQEIIETTTGRIILNNTLPADHPYLNKVIDIKSLKILVKELVEKYPHEQCVEILDQIKNLGFEFSTLSGVSWGMDDLIIPPQKEKLIEEAEKEVEKINSYYKKGLLSKEEKTAQVILIWQGVKSKLENLLKETLPKDGSVLSIINAGARGIWAQPVQMAGMKGLVNNPAGDIIELPVKSSFAEGFNVLEYFISTHGARKGTADTALRTSSAGYLTRRLVDVAHDIIITEEDCGTKSGLTILRKDADDIEQNFSFKIVGRVCLENITKGKTVLVKKGEVINWRKAELIEKEKIEKVVVRSPLTCKTLGGICRQCYGWDLGRNQLIELGQAVGVVAAQAIGEPGTQLTLRTHHLGGVAGAGDITQGLPRVEEIFEARSPKGEAVMSLVEGRVLKVDEEKRIVKIEPVKSSKKPARNAAHSAAGGDAIDYRIPGRVAIFVKAGDIIKESQPLCEGSLDLKKLYRTAGLEETQRYIVKEVQKIYASQSVDIHDKHIEIIVQKMFSKVRIKDEGNADWVKGEVVDKNIFQETVQKIKKQGKKLPLAQPLLFGISEVALASESFLSAASFQQTSRVLIRAALEGKEDKLVGLKENVIIGKLIPVGTGFKK